jgi:hypothetical protein
MLLRLHADTILKMTDICRRIFKCAERFRPPGWERAHGLVPEDALVCVHARMMVVQPPGKNLY